MSNKIIKSYKKCKQPDCNNKHLARGFCQKHYDRLRSSEGHRRYQQLLGKAKAKNVECDISEEELSHIASQGYHYCGSKRISYGHGLDRINPNIGYLKSNVIPCCGYCNKIKFNLITHDEMIEVIKILKSLRGENIWQNFEEDKSSKLEEPDSPFYKKNNT